MHASSNTRYSSHVWCKRLRELFEKYVASTLCCRDSKKIPEKLHSNRHKKKMSIAGDQRAHVSHTAVSGIKMTPHSTHKHTHTHTHRHDLTHTHTHTLKHSHETPQADARARAHTHAH